MPYQCVSIHHIPYLLVPKGYTVKVVYGSTVVLDVPMLYQDGTKMGSSIEIVNLGKNSYLQVFQISSYDFELHYKVKK